jgi:hypothetical protein
MITMAKAAFNKKTYISKLDFDLRKKLVQCYIWCIALKHGHLGEKIRSAWKVLKCGAQEGWRR